MIQIKLQAAPSGQPGHGELEVRGWSHGGGACELCVQRNQDGCYLGNDEGWENSEVWHRLESLREGDDALLGDIGPWLIDALTHDQRYRLTLRNPQGSENGVLRIVGTLLSSKAAGSSRFDEKKLDHTAKPAVVELPAPDPLPVAEPPDPPPPEAKKSKLPLIPILLLLALALAAAAAWFFLRKPSGDLTAAPEAAAPEAPAPSVPATAFACGPETLAGTRDDLSFIQACLKSNPSSEQVLAVIDAAKKAGRCNVAQRLYANRAQAGDAAVALAYARGYDPKHYASGGCIGAADAKTAVYWYEIVVERDPQNKDAQQRLKELRQ